MLKVLFLVFSFSSLEAFPGWTKSFDELKFIFVTEGNDQLVLDYIELSETKKLLEHPKYDNSRPTMLYGFGYTETFTSASVQTIVASYLKRDDHNIVVIEWSEYNNGRYSFEAVPNSYKVGEIIGKTLLNMNDLGFNLEKFHLVGHSLGGQLVGFIGRSYFKNSNETLKIQRITSLDPAGPVFYGIGSFNQKPINKEDGVFVDVIHTDTRLMGAPTSTGTVDFYPNEGKNQPDCPYNTLDLTSEENYCSHRRSWAYYSESLNSTEDNKFHSISCESWDNFKNNDCAEQSSVKSVMGFYADRSLVGDYFLQTNGESPFNRGESGTSYRN